MRHTADRTATRPEPIRPSPVRSTAPQRGDWFYVDAPINGGLSVPAGSTTNLKAEIVAKAGPFFWNRDAANRRVAQSDVRLRALSRCRS